MTKRKQPQQFLELASISAAVNEKAVGIMPLR
jgi:hypothetical protein